MNPLDEIKEIARRNPKRIIYPEGEDVRVIEAVSRSVDQGLVSQAILVGDESVIKSKAGELNVSLDKCLLVDPARYDEIDEFSEFFFKLRKHKGITKEESMMSVRENLIFAGLYTRSGYADGFIGGCVNTTGATVKAALYTLGLAPGNSTLSSFFIIYLPDSGYGDDGLFLFADCAVIPDPSPKQLANITHGASKAYKSLFNKEARCALLSYSSKGSSKGRSVNKVRLALEIIKEKYPDIIADGELQLDSAICEDVGQSKAPDSSVAGRANVLIFPDLTSGNIGYKLVDRLANAQAIGPILTGLAYPANDLSRGCSVEDIIGVTAVTSAQ